MLESYAAELAARTLRPEQIDELQARAWETHDFAVRKPEGFREAIAIANSRLHAIIIGAASSGRLSTMISGVMEMPLVMRTLWFYSDDDLLRSAGHHAELVVAFRAKDPQWAASVMRGHLLAALHVMRKAMAPSKPPPKT